MIGRWVGLFVVLPAALAVLLSTSLDITALPFVSPERVTAVLLVDGQAYFGHLDDSGASGTIRLSDVYYFQDAKSGGTALPLGLIKRGSEAHQPADTMRINRDKVLAIERLAPSSSVVHAIAAERALGQDASGPIFGRRLVADPALVATQRRATENALARGYLDAIQQVRKARTELALPVNAQTASNIASKATDDLQSVRRAALGVLASTLGMAPAEADAYIRTTEARLDAPDANQPPLLLAPHLYAIVQRADQLDAQVRDDAINLMTKPAK